MAEKNPNLSEARESLPSQLRGVFDKLVEDYRFAAFERHGSPFVSYRVLADLVELGWRRDEVVEDG